MSKTKLEDVVVTFKSRNRTIHMYFTELEDGGLDMQMDVQPEFDPEKGEGEPDLCMLIASSLLGALNTDSNKEDDLNPKVYDGTN